MTHSVHTRSPRRVRLAAALALALAPAGLQAGPRTREWKWDKFTRTQCHLHMPPGWDWMIFKALIKQESRFDPNAVSYVGAAGLTQLMPATARELGLAPEDRFAPKLSINGGVRYLRKTWNVWKAEKDGEPHNWERTRFALGSYNAGVGTILRGQRHAGHELNLPTDEWASIDKALRQVQTHWRETTTYVRRIFGYYAEFVQERRPAILADQPKLPGKDRSHWIAVRAAAAAQAATPTPAPAPPPEAPALLPVVTLTPSPAAPASRPSPVRAASAAVQAPKQEGRVRSAIRWIAIAVIVAAAIGVVRMLFAKVKS